MVDEAVKRPVCCSMLSREQHVSCMEKRISIRPEYLEGFEYTYVSALQSFH